MADQTLLLIDGFNLLSRGYFATAYGKSENELPRNSQGLFTNGLRVFFQKMANLIAKHRVTHLAVAWDVKKDETFRNQKYEFYKASRGDLPGPLIQQYETCRQILDTIGIRQFSVPAYEADDIIGTLSAKWCGDSLGTCLIYSNDRDLFQLLSENTHQIIANKTGDILYTMDSFIEDHSIHPNQWVDVKALLGDKSDNIPGCPGVGEKSALPLIQEYGSLEKVYEGIDRLDKKFNRVKKKLIDGRETVWISKELSEIVCDISEIKEIPFDDIKLEISKDQLRNVFQNYGFTIKI